MHRETVLLCILPSFYKVVTGGTEIALMSFCLSWADVLNLCQSSDCLEHMDQQEGNQSCLHPSVKTCPPTHGTMNVYILNFWTVFLHKQIKTNTAREIRKGCYIIFLFKKSTTFFCFSCSGWTCHYWGDYPVDQPQLLCPLGEALCQGTGASPAAVPGPGTACQRCHLCFSDSDYQHSGPARECSYQSGDHR